MFDKAWGNIKFIQNFSWKHPSAGDHFWHQNIKWVIFEDFIVVNMQTAVLWDAAPVIWYSITNQDV